MKLVSGEEIYCYLPEPPESGVLMVWRPLLAISNYERDLRDSFVLLAPWSMVTTSESYALNVDLVIAVYPVTKDIGDHHTRIWDQAQSLLQEDKPPTEYKFEKVGELSKDTTMLGGPPSQGNH